MTTHRNEGDLDYGLPLTHVTLARENERSTASDAKVEHVGILPDVVEYRHVLRITPEGGEERLVLADDRGRLAVAGREFVTTAARP